MLTEGSYAPTDLIGVQDGFVLWYKLESTLRLGVFA
jgi:hypothetical protein